MTNANADSPLLSPQGKAFDRVCMQAQDTSLARLFAQDSGRFARFSLRVGGVLTDFSKTHISDDLLAAGADLLEAARWPQAMQALVSGEIVNPSEGRPALHTAARGFMVPDRAADGSAVAADLADADARMEAIVAAVRTAGRYAAVLHIGIGGSFLGPALAVDALAASTQAQFDVRFLANVDGQAFAEAVRGLDPSTTLLVACSKSWTTLETQSNLQLALGWKAAAGIARPADDLIAITARPDLARAQGVAADRILPMGDYVGGRYSLWSAVGLPVALTYGWPCLAALRAGAREMDAHALTAPASRNMVAISAIMGLAYAARWGRATRAVFAYDERLARLVSYLGQLELESNGKGVTRSGQPYAGPAMPVVWGGLGTDQQHAVFQWLHQSTDWAPVDFITVRTPAHTELAAHQALVGNCLAQSRALMLGRTDGVPPEKGFPGNRPSTTILMDALTPESLGALLAYYEHRTYTLAVLMGINCFDQMGVELGKQMSLELAPAVAGGPVNPEWDSSTRGLIAALRD